MSDPGSPNTPTQTRLDDLHRALVRRVSEYRRGFDRLEKQVSSGERKILDLTEALSDMTDERDHARRNHRYAEEMHAEATRRWKAADSRQGDAGWRPPASGPEVITLCGSMRFFDDMLTVATDETNAGHVVFVPFPAEATREEHDALHRRKIDLSTSIVVVTRDGYIGASTREEIDYAKATGKAVRYVEVPPAEEPTPTAGVAVVRKLHSEFKIYSEECGHEHEYSDDGVLEDGVKEIEDVGLVCEDGYEYSICRECCTNGSGYQSEGCSNHDHDGGCWPCNTIQAVDAAEWSKGDALARIKAALAVLDAHDQPDGVGSLIDAATAALRGSAAPSPLRQGEEEPEAARDAMPGTGWLPLAEGQPMDAVAAAKVALAEKFTSTVGAKNPAWDIDGPDDDTNPYYLTVPMSERVEREPWVHFTDTDGHGSMRAASIPEIVETLAGAGLLATTPPTPTVATQTGTDWCPNCVGKVGTDRYVRGAETRARCAHCSTPLVPLCPSCGAWGGCPGCIPQADAEAERRGQ